jgi:hypothetical protein
MRFMMIMYPGKHAEAGTLPTTEQLTVMGKFNEEMVKAGILLAGEGLHPSSRGARVRFSGGNPTVMDGPFTESKEIIGGYWIIQVRSREEAVSWASRCPTWDNEMIELRQVYEAADFAPSDPTGELRAKEEELRKASRSRS